MDRLKKSAIAYIQLLTETHNSQPTYMPDFHDGLWKYTVTYDYGLRRLKVVKYSVTQNVPATLWFSSIDRAQESLVKYKALWKDYLMIV